MRSEWTAKRRNDTIRTQMHYARKGIVTEEMQYVARRERLHEPTGDVVRLGAQVIAEKAL